MSLHIQFERTGGLAGPAQRRTLALDADALPAPEAEELRGLVRAAGVAALAGQSSGEGPARPDAFRYRLTIDDGGRRHTIEVGEREVPPALRPLLNWLAKRAAPGQPH
jgi:hypothetical protein